MYSFFYIKTQVCELFFVVIFNMVGVVFADDEGVVIVAPLYTYFMIQYILQVHVLTLLCLGWRSLVLHSWYT